MPEDEHNNPGLNVCAAQVRSKALKCLASVVHEDPSVLSRDDMQQGVNYRYRRNFKNLFFKIK